MKASSENRKDFSEPERAENEPATLGERSALRCPHCEGTGEIKRPGLGTLVLAQRQRRGLTQAELSVSCGLGRAQIANIEAGRTDVPTKTLIRIADALGVRPGDLLP